MPRAVALCVALILIPSSAYSRRAHTDCEVAGMLSAFDAPVGTAALTTTGDVQEVETAYIPTTIKTGLYKVAVTRKGDDLYTIDGSKLAVHTQLCIEYGYSEDASLDVRSVAGVTVGTLTFKEP